MFARLIVTAKTPSFRQLGAPFDRPQPSRIVVFKQPFSLGELGEYSFRPLSRRRVKSFLAKSPKSYQTPEGVVMIGAQPGHVLHGK